jgi:hypothetical protein
LQALGKPRPNAVKVFSTVELIALLADWDWLDEATKTIGQFWKRKNARRNCKTYEKQTSSSFRDSDSNAPSTS